MLNARLTLGSFAVLVTALNFTQPCRLSTSVAADLAKQRCRIVGSFGSRRRILQRAALPALAAGPLHAGRITSSCVRSPTRTQTGRCARFQIGESHACHQCNLPQGPCPSGESGRLVGRRAVVLPEPALRCDDERHGPPGVDPPQGVVVPGAVILYPRAWLSSNGRAADQPSERKKGQHLLALPLLHFLRSHERSQPLSSSLTTTARPSSPRPITALTGCVRSVRSLRRMLPSAAPRGA